MCALGPFRGKFVGRRGTDPAHNPVLDYLQKLNVGSCLRVFNRKSAAGSEARHIYGVRTENQPVDRKMGTIWGVVVSGRPFPPDVGRLRGFLYLLGGIDRWG